MQRRLVTTAVVAGAFLLTVGPAWLGLYSEYIQFVLVLVGVNIILTASLNLINGYMGEFSVGHAAFMGVGAYVASVVAVALLTTSSFFGPPILAGSMSLVVFPIALALGGIAAAVFSLLVAVPSFRTRGDYLAVVTLAVNFIFKSVVENLEAVGGPRGFMGMGSVLGTMNQVIGAPWLMIWTFLAVIVSLYVISTFVGSTLGKGVIAIRDDEIAAEVMTVPTRRLKVTVFMLGCGLAGVAGGLHGHLLGFINPSSYFILQSTLVLVMVYLGGMGSLSGSIISAIAFTLMLEALRPLGVVRWVLVPAFLILLMRFRPTGLLGDRELVDAIPALRRLFPANGAER